MAIILTKMKVISSILLCHLGWLSATLMVYHEPSMKEFGSKITTNNTSFGYSVTYTPDNKRLIVSAPKATDHGALFTCDINGTDCTSIFINIKEIEAPKNYHIWLGATVRAGSNFFMTCAPRYRLQRPTLTSTPSRCYRYSESGKYKKRLMRLQPLPETYFASDPFRRMISSIFGWSMDIDEHDNAIIGGPAMFTGRAVKYDYSESASTKTLPPVVITLGGPKPPYPIKNFGYSVVHRKYNSEMQIAVSSTYGELGYGMVVLYNDKNAIISKIRGNQVGAMFGASLCAASVDAKGQALLLVGAPTYTSENKYNTGAVFIYKDQDNNIFNTVKGTHEGGQFGYACANLGDLNGDNKDEIAISAPYEDEGRGAVYIYSGAQLIDRDKEVTWLQRLHRTEYHSFGLSLYAIPDHDGNGCKEMAIGIPENDRAVLFTCLATITVTVRPLKPKGKTNDTVGFSSFIFESCLTINYPALPKSITADFSVKLDIPNVLIKLPATGQSSNDSISYNIHVTSDKKQEYCEDLIISVPTDKTYDPTIHYQISAVLLNDPKYMSDFDPSRVTVSDLSKLAIPGTTWIGECENGDKCKPKLEMDLILSITNSPYVVGSTEVETVKISVTNTGDPAYEACVRVFMYGINPLSWPPSCMHPYDVNAKETLICSPIKLLRNNTSWDIDEIKLDMKTMKRKADGGDGNFDVHVHLYEECSKRSSLKMINKTTPIHWDSEHVTVLGFIKHGGVINITRNEIEFSSKQIQHEYEVSNHGPTTWNNVKVTISLQKEFFLDGISPTSGTTYECTPGEETDKEYINHCVVTTLKSNTNFVIVQPIDVTSKIYDTLKKGQLMVTSSLKMSLDEDEKIASVITTLRFYKIEVATWIIVVAVLFGLLIIAITVFILHKNGCLRRKNKDNLIRLRNNVQRQSMVQSTAIQHNVGTDKEENIDPAEEANPDDETASTTAKVDANEKVDIQEQKDQNEAAPKNCENYHEVNKYNEKLHTKGKKTAKNGVKPGETSEKEEKDM